MDYTIYTDVIGLTYDPHKASLTVTVLGRGMEWRWGTLPAIHLADGRSFLLTDGVCESREDSVGVLRGVSACYRDIPDGAGGILPFAVDTFVGVDTTTSELVAEVTLRGDSRGEIHALDFPPAMEFDVPEGHGYTVLPRMQGALIPAGHPIKVEHGIIYERDAYIPVFGQIHDGCGYAAIYETPFDARYRTVGEKIQPFFITSLGYMGYKRTMRYRFFGNGDFTTVAKIYRAYLQERGELVTLEEKIARNPRLAEMIGTPIVHTWTAIHIHPVSHFYDAEHPENNDACFPFCETGKLLRGLKEKGAEKVYLHLDGWGHHGYDNLHPDPFPIHEGAGGADGMRELMETCHELGYLFGIHDQYRDYYYDGPTFSLDNAILNIDGTHPYCDYWNGGPHSFLCAQLAMGYVRRNYDEFERLGITLDGSYLDVFSVVGLDECFDPRHPMTREECAAARRRCLELLTERGIIPSSEEVLGCIMNAQALCHHAPFYTTNWEDPKAENVGIPIPFLSLVCHDCIITPWFGLRGKGGWGIAGTDRGLYWALLTGGTIYYDVDASAEDVAFGKIALEHNRRVAFCELLSHEFIDGHPRRRRSIFSDGTVVECDFDAETFVIRYPDGTVASGS